MEYTQVPRIPLPHYAMLTLFCKASGRSDYRLSPGKVYGTCARAKFMALVTSILLYLCSVARCYTNCYMVFSYLTVYTVL